MISLERILIPTDFSDLAAHALRYACDLSRAYRAELHVLHVVTLASDAPLISSDSAGMGGMGGIGGTALLESMKEDVARKSSELNEHIARFARDLPSKPVAVVRTGIPWSEIAQYSEDARINMIVMGSHARGVMKRILLGSTSKSVLEHVARPVLMVPIAAMEAAPQPAPGAASKKM